MREVADTAAEDGGVCDGHDAWASGTGGNPHMRANTAVGSLL